MKFNGKNKSWHCAHLVLNSLDITAMKWIYFNKTRYTLIYILTRLQSNKKRWMYNKFYVRLAHNIVKLNVYNYHRIISFEACSHYKFECDFKLWKLYLKMVFFQFNMYDNHLMNWTRLCRKRHRYHKRGILIKTQILSTCSKHASKSHDKFDKYSKWTRKRNKQIEKYFFASSHKKLCYRNRKKETIKRAKRRKWNEENEKP